MTAPALLSWLIWIFPVVHCACALIIARKLRWSRQPALLTFLISEAWVQVLLRSEWLTRDYAILIQLAAGALLVSEMAKLNRIPLHPRVMACASALAVAGCAFLASQPWTMDAQFSLLRCDLRIARALAALAICIYRWHSPAFETHAESRRNRVYRFGMSAYLVTGAVQGSFVRGGLGMRLVPYSPERWTWVGIVTCASVLAVVVVMAIQMSNGPGNKRAAKTPKGATRTGLIETLAA